jgi:hypothetical protein
MSLYLAHGLTSYSKELHEKTLNAYGGIARSRCGYTAGQNIGQNIELYKRSQALWFVSKSKQPLLTWHHGLQLPELMQSRGKAFRLFRADVGSSDCTAAKNEDGVMGPCSMCIGRHVTVACKPDCVATDIGCRPPPSINAIHEVL